MRNSSIAIIIFFSFCLVFAGQSFSNQLFWDDFEQDTVGKEPSKWAVGEGNTTAQVIEDPDNPNNKVFDATDRIDGGKTGRHYIIGDKSWKDYIAEWDWLFYSDGYWGMAFRFQDPENYYLVDRRMGGVEVNFYSRKSSSWNLMKGGTYQNELNVWYRCRLEVIGDSFSFKIKELDDDTPFSAIDPILEASDSSFDSGGMSNAGISYIDNIVVGETESDLRMSVEPADKLATCWGDIKSLSENGFSDRH